MADEIDLVVSRLLTEEGKRPFAYNDLTGKRVTCQPGGNLSIGVGLNLETGLDNEEIEWLLRHRVGKTAVALVGYSWYQKCNAPRRSALLDIGFNGGVGDLLHYPRMLAAIGRDDWMTTKVECKAKDPRLAGRYDVLGNILLTGVIPA